MTPTRGAPSAGAGRSQAPWLSVLVPAFNVAPYVERMLDSVRAQADAGVEIVVVDDASTDGTAERLERIAACEPRLRLVRHAHNAGVAATRNRLLDLARGDYLWFVDADDLLRRGALAGLAGVLRAGDVDLVTCDFRTVGGPPWLRRRRSTFHGEAQGSDAASLVGGALEAGQLHVWSKIARRGLWDGIRFPERRRFEDMTAVLRLLAAAGRWRHVAQAWIGYRHRQASLSHDVPAAGLADYADALGEIRAVAAAHAHVHAVGRALDYFLLRGHASIARRLVQGALPPEDAVAAACRARFDIDFPDRGAAALHACRARGWWLRAQRIERALVRAGWR